MNEREVAEGLRHVSEHLARRRIDLLAEEPEIPTACGEHPVHLAYRCRHVAQQRICFDEPKSTRDERALFFLHPAVPIDERPPREFAAHGFTS